MSSAAGQISLMVKRIALSRVAAFWLVAVCAATSQSERPVRRVQTAALPDAPSASLASETERYQGLPSASLSRPVEATEVTPAGIDVSHSVPGFREGLSAVYKPVLAAKNSNALLNKFLYPSLPKQSSRYQPSSSDRLVGRATDAATRVLLTRDASGRRKLNTPYIVRVATYVAAHAASRPYYSRSNSAPLSDFGSTIGNDAGMNLLHEFGPGLQKMATAHMPNFVSRLEDRVAHLPSSKKASSSAAK